MKEFKKWVKDTSLKHGNDVMCAEEGWSAGLIRHAEMLKAEAHRDDLHVDRSGLLKAARMAEEMAGG